MKKLLLLILFSGICFFDFAQTTPNEEKLDLPGDNLNLYAVLKLFQESPTLEGFEKSLNDESLHINNLDLDGDGKIDYIKVIDNADGNVRNIALRVSVNKDEDQDVAVFVVQKDNDGKVQIQLVGDEDLYGKDYIIEPNYESTDAGTPNPGYIPPPTTELDQEIEVQPTTPAEVATWTIIRFIYVPTYVVWRSPWYWGHYPAYWRPWKPFYWHYYYGYHYHWDYFYYGHYRRWKYYRYPSWRAYYYRPGFRRTSVFVEKRFKRGDYKNTYSRPDLAKQGALMFKKNFPKAPSVKDKLPSFDKAGRPVHPKPSKPSTTKPVIKPNPKPIAKPRPKPTTKPVVKPVHPVTRAITKPTNPSPVTNPLKPTIKPHVPNHNKKPAVTKPVTRDKDLKKGR